MDTAPAAITEANTAPERRRAVVVGAADVTRTIGQPGLLERAGATQVVREQPTRFDVLVQRLSAPAQTVPDDLPPGLHEWFSSMVSTEAGADDVSLVVMSLRHELVGPEPWRHRGSGLLLEPPVDYESKWSADEIAWLEGQCDPAGAVDAGGSLDAMRQIIERLHGDGRTVFMLTMSTYDPADTTFSYTGIDDTPALRAHRLIAEVQRLAIEEDVGFADVDRAIAELGAKDHVPAFGDFSDDAAAFITEEASDAFDQAAIFGESVQPDVMRLTVPAYDRRTAEGRIACWHVQSETPIERGDDLFDVVFENLPLRIDQPEEDRDKRRPTTGRRQTRSRTMTATVVAASSGYLSSILAGEGSAVAVGDAVALVAPSKPAHALAVEDAEGDFRVASRRVLVSDTRSNQGGEE